MKRRTFLKKTSLVTAGGLTVLNSPLFGVNDAAGKKFPEFVHNRTITKHPRWLMTNALRPAYGHFEWDQENTLQSLAGMAREAGANCLVGVGEMPAGTLNGKMKAYPFQSLDKEGFELPPAYKKDDYSWVKEFVDAGHSEGLKVVLYDGSWRTLDPILFDHPEWRQHDAKGVPYRPGFGSWHSPYRKAYIERWVKVAKEYDIDGIMVDMLFTGPRYGDYSSFTVKAFKNLCGVEPPEEPGYNDLNWQRWIDFQAWTREEVMLDLTEALHAVNPEIACIWNQTTGWIFEINGHYLTSRAGSCADGLLEEMGWEASHGVFDRRPLAWPLSSAWQSLFLHCRTAYGQMWHKGGYYTRVSHEALSYSMFANGVAPAVWVGGNWEYLKQVWQHIKPCETYMTGAKLVPYTALHFSEKTLKWYAEANGNEASGAYIRNVFGFFQALLETHLPVAIITDDAIGHADALKRYKTVILPNTACLSDTQAAELEAYVKEGGGLVASFETGVFDEHGKKREKPALEALSGVAVGNVKEEMDWILDLDKTNQRHEIISIPEITNGGDLSQGSKDRMPFLTFFDHRHNRDARIVRTTAFPGVQSVRMKEEGFSVLHTRTVENGRVAWFPPDIGQGYFLYNHPVGRRLIERTVRWAAGKPPVMETDAPMAVQTVCYRKGNDLLVHLVNDNSSYGRAAAPNPENFGAFRDEVLPVYNIRLTVKDDYRKAVLLPEGRELAVQTGDEGVDVTVPRADIHVMVVFSK